jgi:hypothetical protein
MHLTQTSLNILHAIKGFLIGISFTVGLGSVVQLRRNRNSGG